MGSAVAGRIVQVRPLMVWNRTSARAAALARAGAVVARSSAQVFADCRIVIVMVTDEHATEEILPTDPSLLAGRIVVQMSTIAPAASTRLHDRVARAGGIYVEAPVSGSRGPAQEGRLVVMLAGADRVLDEVATILRPASTACFRCGAVPRAMTMKLAVNTFLITLVTGLAECFHFAEAHDLPVDVLREILDSGPMASVVSQAKTRALATRDLEPQAAVPDVLKNASLVADAARAGAVAAPLIEHSRDLYREALGLGLGHLDMAAVIDAYRARTGSIRAVRPQP